MWPFNRGPSKRALKNEIVALLGSIDQINAQREEDRRLRRNAQTRLRKAELDMERLVPEFEALRSSNYLATQNAKSAMEELRDLKCVLVGYGYPVAAGELRGKLKMDEEMYLALKRKQRVPPVEEGKQECTGCDNPYMHEEVCPRFGMDKI